MDRQLQIILKLQDQASNELRNVLGNLNGIQSSTQGVAGQFDQAGQAILRMASAYLSFRTIYSGLALGLQTAADLQTAQVGIQTLTGSAKDAAETIARIKIEAMRTPFTINGLATATQLMSSVTHDGGKALDLVLNMGEALAALGKGQPELDRIMINMQQIAALGYAQTIDIKQFAFAGIPIYDMLATQTGIARDQLGEFIRDHGVTYTMLADMFDKANDKGGQFFNAYKNQIGTFNQASSNFRDSIAITAASLVTQSGLFKDLSAAMIAFSNVVQEHPKLAQATMVLVGALAALVGVMASIAVIGPLVAAGFALMTGPVGLLIAALVAAGLIIFQFKANIATFGAQLELHTGIVAALRQAWELISSTFNTQLQPALAKLWIALQPLLPFLTQLAHIVGAVLAIAFTQVIQQIANFITTTSQLLALLMQTAAWITTNLVPGITAIGTAVQVVTDKVTALISAFSRLSGIKASGSGLVGSIFSAVGATLPIPFATGGIVTSPTLGLVGEAGPEAIIPLSQMGRMGGITVNVYGDVSGRELVERVKEQLMTALGANARLVI